MTVNRELGCVLGHLCADAAGGTLEFYKSTITDKKAFDSMKMPGGGTLGLGRGQITDDGELALCLLSALFDVDKNCKPVALMNIDDIARRYVAWYKSVPIDCGLTCGRAFGVLHGTEANIGMNMMDFSIKNNKFSEANGALMRVFPIALWAIRKNMISEQIWAWASMDAMLSHPNRVCQDANAVYCLLLCELLKGNPDPIGAVDNCGMLDFCHPKVRDWYHSGKSLENLDNMNVTMNMGHVKYAFIMAVHFAASGKKYTYENGILGVLKLGGDTDTNAAICGAILGAIYGAEGIPKYMIDPVMAFEGRPKIYLPGFVLPKVFKQSDLTTRKA